MATLRHTDISEYQPDPENANAGSERGTYLIEESLREAGAGRSILADRDGVVVAGNKTLEACAAIGIEKVVEVETDGTELVVVRRRDLSLAGDDDDRARLLAFRDNRAGQVSLTWDYAQIAADLTRGLDLSGLFFGDELLAQAAAAGVALDAALVAHYPVSPGAPPPLPAVGVPGANPAAPSAVQPGVDPDALPEERDAPTRCQHGDVWTLGRHSLICGDGTNPATLALLLQPAGGKVDMVFTDPPYNIDYGATKNPRWRNGPDRKVEGDKLDPVAWSEFCEHLAEALAGVTDGCVYVCHAPGPDGRVMARHLDQRLYCSTTVVWNKDRFTLGRGKYQQKFEPIWFGWVKDGTNFSEDRTLSNVWDLPRPSRSDDHPTMKPVALVETALAHACPTGGTVLDPFMGSGTTYIAAEQQGRTAYGCELVPRICDVILKRWEDATAIAPVRLSGPPVAVDAPKAPPVAP